MCVYAGRRQSFATLPRCFWDIVSHLVLGSFKVRYQYANMSFVSWQRFDNASTMVDLEFMLSPTQDMVGCKLFREVLLFNQSKRHRCMP